MLRFNDFIATFSTLGAWRNNPYARHIYEEIIGREGVRVKMALASEFGLPALSVCAAEIEAYCDTAPGCNVDLSNPTVRQSIGRMVNAALQPLGYRAGGRMRLSSDLRLRHFKNASCFHRQGTPMQVTIVGGGNPGGGLTCLFH